VKERQTAEVCNEVFQPTHAPDHPDEGVNEREKLNEALAFKATPDNPLKLDPTVRETGVCVLSSIPLQSYFIQEGDKRLEAIAERIQEEFKRKGFLNTSIDSCSTKGKQSMGNTGARRSASSSASAEGINAAKEEWEGGLKPFQIQAIKGRRNHYVQIIKIEGKIRPSHLLPRDWIDYQLLCRVAGILARTLDKMIDINYYPTVCMERGAKLHRSFGIGIQGLADLLNRLRVRWDSLECMIINEYIAETILFGAMTMSHKRAKKFRCYKSFHGSPASKGWFSFNLWGMKPSSGMWDWQDLKAKVMAKGVYKQGGSVYKGGLHNVDFTAYMPMASTAIITGSSKCFEPQTYNVTARWISASHLPIFSKELAHYLTENGLYNKHMISMVANTLKNINPEIIPECNKAIFTTAFNLDQRILALLGNVRGPFMSRGQSMNYFAKLNNKGNFNIKNILEHIFYSFYLKNKNCIYYCVTNKKETSMDHNKNSNNSSSNKNSTSTKDNNNNTRRKGICEESCSA
jgi:ribonucleotide reductase alpha subunit